MLFDEEETTDYDDIAAAGETKEIARAEKKAAKKAKKDEKKRAKLLKEAERLGFTPEMLGEDFGKEMSLEEILNSKPSDKKDSNEADKKSEDKASENKISDEKSENKASGDKFDEVKSSEGETAEGKSSDNSIKAEKISAEKLAEEAEKVEGEKAEGEKAEGEKSEEEKSEEDKKKKKKRGYKERDPHYNIVKELLTTIIYMGGVILLVFVLFTYVGQKVVVDGSSMNPTLEDQDYLWVDKLRYRFTDPKRFDVIVFPYRPGSDILFIKRIIGLPGETVQIDNGKIYINGNLLDEDYGLATIEDPGVASSKVILAHDEYFVLGDNRNNSNDSRKSDVGNIKRENIMGKAVLRVSPFSKFGDFEKKDKSE